MTLLINATYKQKTDEIIEGKRILDISKSKLKKFSFIDSMDFDSPGLRKFLLISNLAVSIVNSEKEFNTRIINKKQKQDYIKTKQIIFGDFYDLDDDDDFDDFDKYETRDDNTNKIDDNISEYRTEDKINPDIHEVSNTGSCGMVDNNIYDDDDEFQEINIITNNGHDNTLGYYENNEKEDTSKEKIDADSYMEDLKFIDHNCETTSSVIVSVAPKNIDKTSVSSQLGKRSLNLDDEIIANSVTYKKVKYI